MVQYPIQFHVSAKSEEGVDKAWRTGTEHTDRYTDAAIPPEFRGPGGGFSPEDLYALSLVNCYVATFKVLARGGQLDYEAIDVTGVLTVDRNEAGTPWMSKMEYRVDLRLPAGGDRAHAEQLLRRTAKNCLIHNSVRTQHLFDYHVNAASAAA